MFEAETFNSSHTLVLSGVTCHMHFDNSLSAESEAEDIMKHVLRRNNCMRKTTKIFLLRQQNRINQFGFAEKYTRLVVQTIKDKNVRGILKNSSQHTS